MKDQDVRFAVHHKLLKESHLDPDCLVVDEFSISLGASRADIAVINGVIHGYELKSEYDSLERLPLQIKHYSSVMDKVTLVVAENTLRSIKVNPQVGGALKRFLLGQRRHSYKAHAWRKA